MEPQSLLSDGSTKRRGHIGPIFPWRRWDIICATITLNMIALVVPLAIIQLYDRIIPNTSIDTLTAISVGIVISIIFESILRFCRSNILNWLGMIFDYVTTVGAFNHLIHAPAFQTNKIGVGKHVENLESISILREFLAGQGFLTLLDMPFIFIFIAVMAYLSPPVAMVPTVVISCFVVIGLWLSIQQQKALKQRQDIDDRRYNFIVQILNNHFTLKTLGMEELILRRYERIHGQCAVIENNINFLSATSRDLASISTYAMFGGIVCVAAYEVIEGRISLGVLSASIILANRAMQPFQSLMATWVRFQHLSQAKQRFREMFSLDQEVKGQSGVNIRGKVHLNHITFDYPDSGKRVLNELSLTVEPGQIVSIHGPNGSGKTTIASILIGNLEPLNGQVLIDDTPLSAFMGPGFRQQVCLVSSKNLLFHGTILENLTTFRKGPIEDEAKAFSQYFGLDPWVTNMPKGYQTMIADQLFLHLPEGIQQRICLIRALVNHPKILILDEANTSLDFQGDELLKQHLKQLKGQTTIIYITHRPSIEAIADVSYDLIDGKLERKIPSSSLAPHTPFSELTPKKSAY